MKSGISILTILLVALLSGCQKKINDEMIRTSPELKVPIVFYFKKGTTREQINNFSDTVISYPHPGGGHSLFKGIRGVFLVGNQDYSGYALDRIDEDERQNILRAINSSPLIYKVFENVIPKEIILDAAKAKREKEELEKQKNDKRPKKEVKAISSSEVKVVNK